MTTQNWHELSVSHPVVLRAYHFLMLLYGCFSDTWSHPMVEDDVRKYSIFDPVGRENVSHIPLKTRVNATLIMKFSVYSKDN